jgi:hypothetical protein
MRLRSPLLSLVCLLAAAACGPSGGAGDDDPADARDADGDTITDEQEGAEARDTDEDGTPDYLDDDSDDDGIPDYREAGDDDLGTGPVDSDGDGDADVVDTDSDDNGRPDGEDGADDLDGDGRFDFQDRDDDDDAINDVHELGPDVFDPIDTDGDYFADFQDPDSDADGTPDLYEGTSDYDEDTIGNWRDLDADGDCRLDAVEGGNPPPDTDGDSRYDFVDRDSDNDGLGDATEDADCDGIRDPSETSATDEDTDNDGTTDMIEEAAGTDPNDATDNPQANGDFVFLVPYQAPPSPSDDDLDFATDLVSVDVYVLLDRSGSMEDEILDVRTNLAQAIDGATCPPNGDGDPNNCIADLWAGAGTIGYQTNDSYHHYVSMHPNPSFGGLPGHITSCTQCKESTLFAMYSAITGLGSSGSGCSVTTVPQQTGCAAGRYGYPCFRDGALPVVMVATDEPPIDANYSDTYKCPSWGSTVRNAYNNRGARVIGITGTSPTTTLINDLETLATGTGAVDSTNNEPMVFNGSNSAAVDAIEDAILTLADTVALDMSAEAQDDVGDAVDALHAFVDHLETLESGPGCTAGLNDVDSDGDGYNDYYQDVRVGTPVCWKVVAKQNTSVPPTDEPQLYRATIQVYGDGVTVLDTRDVFFLVPPDALDPPVD